jgi:hypothetical protein
MVYVQLNNEVIYTRSIWQIDLPEKTRRAARTFTWGKSCVRRVHTAWQDVWNGIDWKRIPNPLVHTRKGQKNLIL